MPALPAITTGAMSNLAEQLRFSPKPALERHIERIEALAGEIDPEGWYEEPWLVAQITGYTPEMEAPAQVSGLGVLRDLSALAERLSDHAQMEPGAVPGAVTLGELCERWGVDRKTIERARKKGLVGRRVRSADGKRVLVFAGAVVERYDARRHGRAALTRMSEADRKLIVSRAGRYRSRLGWDVSRISRRLGERLGRHPDTVRRTIRASWGPELTARGGRTERLVVRASARGIGPDAIAERLSIDARGAARAGERWRRRSLEEALGSGPAQDARVEAPGGWPEAFGSLRAMAEAMENADRPAAGEESGAAACARALASRARSRLGGGAVALDEAETDARRVAQVLAGLAWGQRRVLAESLESRLGVRLVEVRAGECERLVRAGLLAAADEAWRWASGEARGRLAARVSVRIGRLVAKSGPASGAGRARAVLSGSATAPAWWWGLAPWQAWLDPGAVVLRGMGSVSDEHRRVTCARFGIGRAPATLAELAGELGTSRPWAVVGEREALRAAFRAGCASGAGGDRLDA